MGSYRDLIYEHIDKQFESMGNAKDYFSDKPLVDPVPQESGLPVQPTGWIAEGAVNDLNLFASTIRPVAIVAALPVLPDADYPVGSTVFLTTDGKIYRNYGDVWTAAVPSSSGGIEILGALPTLPDAAYPPGSLVFLTTDDKLYRNDDDVWSVAVDGADIMANTITANAIFAGTITTAEIAASTIQGSNIAANTITAGNIAADTITAGEIAAGAISTSELAAGAVTAAKIAANQIQVGHFASPPDQVVSNGSFEIDANGTIDPNITGWQKLLGTSANYVISTTTPKYGDKCLLITASSVTEQDFVQDKFIPVEGGRAYKLVGFIRGKATNGAGANGKLGVAWYDSAQGAISTSTASVVTVGTSTSYTESNTEFTAPSTAVYAKVVLYTPTTNTTGDVIGFDAINLYRADQDIYHSGGNVVITAAGITITNGYLTFADQYGNNVITGAGFGASWVDFISSHFYNHNFAIGTTNSITAATGADDDEMDEATYLSYLSDDIPYWVVSEESGAGTLKRVVDADASGGYVLQWNGTESAHIYQDIPIVPGQSYNIIFNYKYACNGDETTQIISRSVRDINHGAIGGSTEDSISLTTDQASFVDYAVVFSGTMDAAARYLRVGLEFDRVSGTPQVNLNSVRVEEGTRETAINWRTAGVGTTSIIRSYDDTGDDILFSITDDGGMGWYDNGGPSYPALEITGALSGTSKIKMSSGAAAADVYMYRSAAKTLKFDSDGAGTGVMGLQIAGNKVARYVSLLGSYSVALDSSSASSIGNTLLELTGLPSTGVVAAFVWVKCQSNTANVSNVMMAKDYGDSGSTLHAPVFAYNGSVAGFPNSGTGIVETGGTNSRQIRYQLNRAAGTVVYQLVVHGYWTTEWPT